MENSVASMIILVLGYSFLKLSGIYFLTMCHDRNVSIDLKLWYIRFIQVFVIRETDSCEIPNLIAISNSGKPSRILTSVKKTVQSIQFASRSNFCLIVITFTSSSTPLSHYRLQNFFIKSHQCIIISKSSIKLD